MLTQALRYNAGRIRVKDCSFGSPDGIASQFQLVDRHGRAISKDVRIASIHQTDWQGRVELSSQPRTQIATLNNDMAAWPIFGQSTTAPGANVTVGSHTFTNSVVVNGNGTPWYGIRAPVPATYSAGLTYVLACIFDASVGESLRCAVQIPTADTHVDCTINVLYPDQLNPQVSSFVSGGNTSGVGEPHLVSLGNNVWIVWCSVTPNVDSAFGTATRNIYVCTMSGDTTAQCHPLAASFVEESELGHWIENATDSPVPLTDYTHDGQGGITTGQVPADGATLDWTGTARRAA